jgi:class 3 adenylate cyclase
LAWFRHLWRSLPAKAVTAAEVMAAEVMAAEVMAAEVMHVPAGTVGVAVMHVADIVAADMAAADMTTDTVVDTVAIMARVTGLAPAFRCRCPLLVAGKLAARRPINLKIGRAFAAG